MDLSPLPPPYPNPSVEQPEDAAGDRDWCLLVRNLLLITAASGFVGLLAFTLSLMASLGQILGMFERRW
jgi:hypothetical protein